MQAIKIVGRKQIKWSDSTTCAVVVNIRTGRYLTNFPNISANVDDYGTIIWRDFRPDWATKQEDAMVFWGPPFANRIAKGIVEHCKNKFLFLFLPKNVRAFVRECGKLYEIDFID
jgi:hypothetical protein